MKHSDTGPLFRHPRASSFLDQLGHLGVGGDGLDHGDGPLADVHCVGAVPFLAPLHEAVRHFLRVLVHLALDIEDIRQGDVIRPYLYLPEIDLPVGQKDGLVLCLEVDFLGTGLVAAAEEESKTDEEEDEITHFRGLGHHNKDAPFVIDCYRIPPLLTQGPCLVNFRPPVGRGFRVKIKKPNCLKFASFGSSAVFEKPRPVAFRPPLTKGLALSGLQYEIFDFLLFLSLRGVERRSNLMVYRMVMGLLHFVRNDIWGVFQRSRILRSRIANTWWIYFR